MVLSSSDIARVGEGIALRDLMLKGYTILKWNPPDQLPGSNYIEAKEAVLRTHVLVQVKSAVKPSEPTSLSSEEEEKLKSHAKKVGFQPWEARVQLESDLKEGTVFWRRLE
jgi:hypothetical protein